MTPEGRIKAKLRKELDKLPKRYIFMAVQQGLGASTLDYLCCINGRFVGIETKSGPNKKLTARQVVVSNQIRIAGGVVYTVDSEEAITAVMARLWLLMEFGEEMKK